MGNHSEKETLENIEGAIKKWQSRETGNNGNTKPRKAMQKKKNKTKPETQYVLDTTIRLKVLSRLKWVSG